MPVGMHAAAVNNYIVVQGYIDSSDPTKGYRLYHDKVFEIVPITADADCSVCQVRTAEQLLTDEHYAGIHGMRVLEGDPGSPDRYGNSFDYHACGVENFTALALDGITAINGYRFLSSILNGTSLVIKCYDPDTSGDPEANVWTGTRLGGQGRSPAGYYDRDGGCSLVPKRLLVVAQSHLPCPCPPVPGTCTAPLTDLKIKNFNINDWTIDTSGSATASLNSSYGGNWGLWRGNITYYGGLGNTCWWLRSGPTPVDVPLRPYVRGAPGTYWPVHFHVQYVANGWWVAYWGPINFGGNALYGMWGKDVGEGPEGTYVLLDQFDHEFVKPGGADPIDCTASSYAQAGPSTIELKYQ